MVLLAVHPKLNYYPYVRQLLADGDVSHVGVVRNVALRQKSMRKIEAGSGSCQEVALKSRKQYAKRPALYTYAGRGHMVACLVVFSWSR